MLRNVTISFILFAAKDESHCVVCSEPGDIHKQLFCTSCGQHYHGDCLEFEIECNTVVRAGWQCPECKVCQECRNPGHDNKMLVCDVCDKGFHTFCLVPAISKVPSNGWRCHVGWGVVFLGLLILLFWRRRHSFFIVICMSECNAVAVVCATLWLRKIFTHQNVLF